MLPGESSVAATDPLAVLPVPVALYDGGVR